MEEKKHDSHEGHSHKTHTHHEHNHHAVHHVKKVKKDNTWKIISGILGVLLLLSLFMGGTGQTTKEGAMDANSASEKAIDYINDNLLQPGTTAKLKDVEEEGGLYKIKMEIGGNEFDSYITKDGNFLFPTAVNMSQVIAASTTTQNTETEDIPKTEKPKVELYVMSFCPFGNKAEDTMYPVYQLLGDKVDWEIRYIVSASGDTIRSLHGQPETDQDIREVCVKKYYGMDKFWKFMTYVNTECGSDGSCWEDAAKEAGVSATKISTCMEEEGIDLMKEEADASGKAGASGSPTMKINGVQSSSVYRYGQVSTYLDAICSAFEEAPPECEEDVEDASLSQGGSC